MPQRDLPWILEQSRQLRAYWGRSKQLMRSNASLYWLEYVFPNPTRVEPVIPPTAKLIVKDLQDRVASEFPVILQPPRSDGFEARQAAERVSAGLEVFWQNVPVGVMDTDIGLAALVRDLVWEGAVKGQFCLATYFNEDAWSAEPITPVRPPASLEDFAAENGGDPGRITPTVGLDFIAAHARYLREKNSWEGEHRHWEDSVRNRIPILCRPILADYVFPSLDGSFVILIQRRTVGDIVNLWPHADEFLGVSTGRRRRSDSVEWLECWDREGRAFVADNQLVQPYAEHGYGFLPFIIDGFWKTPNRHSGDRELAHRGYESLYSGLEHLFRSEVALETITQAILEGWAWPQFTVKTDSPETVDIQTGPDAVSVIGKDDSMERQGGIAPPPALVQITERHRRILQDSSGSGAAQSVTGGRESGYSRAIQSQYARLKDQPVESALGGTIARASENVLRLVVNKVRTKLYMWGTYRSEDVEAALDPKDVKDYYRVRVVLKAVQPMDEAQRVNTGLALFNAGAISLETFATEYAGRKDFWRDFRRRIREKVLNSDAVMAALEMLFTETWGLPGPAEQAYEAAVAAVQQPPGSTMSATPMADTATQSAAGAPGAAIPGSPLETAQQLSMARRAGGLPPQLEGAPPMQPRAARGNRGGRRRGNRLRFAPATAPSTPVPYRE